MQSKVKISVLVPICNVAAYLEQCLDSLISQTYRKLEIICVDDGSTDESGQIADRYAARDSRFKVIHKENTGYGNSMNAALSHATGDYIAILESDDFAEPDMLEKLCEAALAYGTDVVKGDYYHYRDGSDSFVHRLGPYSKNRILSCAACPDILNLADSIWSCLYRHSFLTDHKIRFHETPGASYQDISFALQTWLYADSVYFIGDALLHYRRDNPNSSMNNPAKLFCVFDEYEWIEKKAEGKLAGNRTLRYYFTASRYRDYLNHYYRVGVQYQYALLLRLAQSFRADKKRGFVNKEAFDKSIWEQLCQIEQDRDHFFQNTARYVPDPRLNISGILNNKIYAKALFETIAAYPKIFFYGAGQVGQGLAKAFIKRGGRVDAFLVTRITEHALCMGIPVMGPEEAVQWADTCAVILAVTEKGQHELYTNLERYGFCHIFRADRIMRENFSGEDEVNGE